MRKTIKTVLASLLLAQCATFGARAATYALDNGGISGVLNASDGTESLDNWFGNVFTAQAGANLINRVDFGLFTTAGTIGRAVIYRVTDPGGNPALGATRLFTQPFTLLTGDGTNAFLQQIPISSPVALNVGDRFLVAIMITNVVGAPPNDKYPYLLDTSGSAAGSYWARSAPGTFNLDNLSGAKLVNQALAPGGYIPGDNHTIIRAIGVDVPEPSVLALSSLAAAALLLVRRRRNAVRSPQ